ncbi:MAG TPA: fluoride efflux transporter CrcB [Povalibacter sp.]|uniref:fluoride efflux transporter CrcB n=1 Tax=Povalibacter sp. TaxID=1962978 RepID=UPI002C97B14B|nr:fluoride efflux transporter CrcB [Povalibacter sp.]HMN45321.1 fluoride efflux transporter CrcB [Povalibacter sp.]
MNWLLIAIGSALGGVARHGCGLLAASRWGASFPWGTLLVNVVGSFLIGLIAALTVGKVSQSAQLTRDFLMVGVMGGFTTFSAFSLQTLLLLREGRLAAAAANVALSVGVCLIVVFLGYLLGTALRPAAV